MNKKIILFLTLLFLISSLHARKNVLQNDISLYIYNAEICEHLAGEIGDQEQLEADILNKNIDKYCGNAHEQLFKLQIKYKNNKKAQDIISKHLYDSVESYSK
jgi:hypothetical protein